MITILLLLLLLYLILKTNVNKEIVLFLIALYFLNYLKNNYFKRDLIEGLDMSSAADFVGLGDEYAAATAATASTWCPPKHMASLAMDWRQTIPKATTHCNVLRYQFDENWFKGDYDDGDDNEVCREHVNDAGDCDDEECLLTEDGRCIPNWIRHINEAIAKCSNFKNNNPEDGCEKHQEVEDDNVGYEHICRWITDEDGEESCEYIYGSKIYDNICASSLTRPDCTSATNETGCSHPLCEWIPPIAATAATATEPATDAVAGVCSDRSVDPLQEITAMKNLCDSMSLTSVGDSENSCNYRLRCNDDDSEEHICEYQTATSAIYPSEYEDDLTESPCAVVPT